MNDPHVEILAYDFRVVAPNHDFAAARAWSGLLGDFDCELGNGKLSARPRGHYATTAEARAALEPMLRGWEATLELENGYISEFTFESAELADRAGPGRSFEGTSTSRAILSGVATVVHSAYPSPPQDPLVETDLLRALRERVRDFRFGRERVLVAAYWCLTRVEGEYGGRQAVAQRLNISANTLDEIGRIAAINGGARCPGSGTTAGQLGEP